MRNRRQDLQDLLNRAEMQQQQVCLEIIISLSLYIKMWCLILVVKYYIFILQKVDRQMTDVDMHKSKADNAVSTGNAVLNEAIRIRDQLQGISI